MYSSCPRVTAQNICAINHCMFRKLSYRDDKGNSNIGNFGIKSKKEDVQNL